MLTIKNLFMFATILVYLVGAFAAPIENYDSQLNLDSHIAKRAVTDKWCKGFKIAKPSFSRNNNQVKANSRVKVTWENGASKVVRVNDLELMQEGVGLLKTYWHGNRPFKDGETSHTIKFDVPPTANRNKPFMLRSWGRTESGPDCTVYSKPFMFD
ncbi:1684_t:CDS:2 [Paraglomus brasilianum]|uniref:1684_t:CDS:1 n=1 Tax=Paraglomus brasilianum TaxID=144538 RepID=A0A9N8Z713_9GLOM|nr:1684_t:CDS:2 [Paraglomus brasilianum]